MARPCDGSAASGSIASLIQAGFSRRLYFRVGFAGAIQQNVHAWCHDATGHAHPQGPMKFIKSKVSIDVQRQAILWGCGCGMPAVAALRSLPGQGQQLSRQCLSQTWDDSSSGTALVRPDQPSEPARVSCSQVARPAFSQQCLSPALDWCTAQQTVQA